MGRRYSDGKTFDATAPNAQVINDYDLYRINGWKRCGNWGEGWHADGSQHGIRDGYQCDV
jgi:hypothetical protein